MIRLHSFLKAVIISAAVAPLLFHWSLVAAWQVIHAPVWARFGGYEDGGVMILLLLSLYYGLLIALVPNLVSTVLLSALGDRHDWARSPFAWAATGAMPALAVAVALDMPAEVPDLAFATIVTSIGTALVCRVFIRWHEPARLRPNVQA